MDIYILRHGKAEEHVQTIRGDQKRKLTESGKKEIELVAKGIKILDIEFDYIISSPLIRAKQTANIALKMIKIKKKSLLIWSELKPESSVDSTIKKLKIIKPSASVLLVGHEPHLSTLTSKIISRSEDVGIILKKGGLVHLRCSTIRSEFVGSLRSLMTPRQIKKLCK